MPPVTPVRVINGVDVASGCGHGGPLRVRCAVPGQPGTDAAVPHARAAAATSPPGVLPSRRGQRRAMLSAADNRSPVAIRLWLRL